MWYECTPPQEIDLRSAHHYSAERGLLGGKGLQLRLLSLAVPSDRRHKEIFMGPKNGANRVGALVIRKGDCGALEGRESGQGCR